MHSDDEIRALNRAGWDARVAGGDKWTLPVSPQVIAQARAGDWSVLLTMTKPTPRDWFGDLDGATVLGLASGGGQQGPVLAAAGARVTVFDASPAQLASDRAVAAREGLEIETVEGFMHDLGAFADASFDLIFHPVSNCFAPDVTAVWREAFRVLRPGGALLAGFMNPAIYLFDDEARRPADLVVRFALPYVDTVDRDPGDVAERIARDQTVEFSHTFDSQIGGQTAAGFHIAGFYEDFGGRLIARYMPAAFATRAVKPI